MCLHDEAPVWRVHRIAAEYRAATLCCQRGISAILSRCLVFFQVHKSGALLGGARGNDCNFLKHLAHCSPRQHSNEGVVMQSTQENKNKNKSLVSFCVGGACGLGAALAFSVAVAFAMTGGALGQEDPAQRAAFASALADCESAAFSGDNSGRAIGACDSVLRSAELGDETRARVLANRGAIAVRRGEAGPALGDLEEAVRLNPEMAEAWLSLSGARIIAGRLNPAIDAAQTALSLDVSQPALAHLNIAIAHEQAGRLDLAYASYVEAASLAPDDSRLAAQPRRFRQHQTQPAQAGK